MSIYISLIRVLPPAPSPSLSRRSVSTKGHSQSNRLPPVVSVDVKSNITLKTPFSNRFIVSILDSYYSISLHMKTASCAIWLVGIGWMDLASFG